MQHLEDGIPQQIHAGLPSCEEELQELMHQIDIMVSRRKQEWERHSQALQACLDAREQELLHARAALDHKHQEVATLQCHIKEMKNSNKELVQKYEERLNTLQSELHKLKVSYEKLQRHHMKQAQEATNEEDSTFESSRLSRKLEDLQAKSKEWEKQSTLHQKELAILESQRRSLAEKCEYFQRTCHSYEGQLCSEWKKQRTCERTQRRRESEAAHVRDSAEQRHEEEVNSAEREQQGEIQHLQQSLIQHQKTGEELKAELKVRDDLLQTAELQEKQWRGEVARLQEQLSMQESAIRMEEQSCRNLMATEMLSLKVVLDSVQQQLKASQQKEKILRTEITRLQAGAEPSCSHCMQLKGSSSVVRENVQWQLKAAGENKDNEIVKLKGILEKLEVSQNTQAEASRDEISRLTAQLRDTESARAAAIQRATLLQNELRKIKGKAAEHQSTLEEIVGDATSTVIIGDYKGILNHEEEELHQTERNSYSWETTQRNLQSPEQEDRPTRDMAEERASKLVNRLPTSASLPCLHDNSLIEEELPHAGMSKNVSDLLDSKEDIVLQESFEAELFLEEEERRSKAVELLFDSYIDQLHHDTWKTLQKYSVAKRI
ncbi:centrosomal protein of 63 kDa isoform X2 [Lepisosteus oculatus]|uniref:centrosomal protein of 63 kDa isoform X2 n=1 Tax=Lepisosteus oculatus TaxID=7918 RepID=UPI00372352C6